MQDACDEIKNKNKNIDMENGVTDTAVSVDGTWQKRGYSSFNGVVTAISMENGKVVDTEALTRYCRGCKVAENVRISDPARYDLWKAEHICLKNHSGSAGAMEVNGAGRIFKRSIEKNGLRYSEYYGNGDSKSFISVKDTYEGISVKKLECVGHVQKRIGTWLRGLKRKNKEARMAQKKVDKTKKLADPMNKLTYAIIDKLQNYYGIVVRANPDNLEGMQKAIRATLFHVASSKDDNSHSQCPIGASSWCKFNRDIFTGETTHKHGSSLPVGTRKVLIPIYNELSSNELLQKCLHGKTQNQNESFNAMIWERLPKTKYNSLIQLELATFDAVAHFNIGHKATVLIYEKLNMIPGKYTLSGCTDLNRKRILHASYKGKAVVKRRRTLLRGFSKCKQDKDSNKEEVMYAPGGF